MWMSLTDFKAKMNKYKINKYKINNNNKTNTKHEFNVKYERYKQDISKDRKLCLENITQFNGQFGKGSVCLYILRFGI
jgi:site-specific DNA-adenine methylase